MYTNQFQKEMFKEIYQLYGTSRNKSIYLHNDLYLNIHTAFFIFTRTTQSSYNM